MGMVAIVEEEAAMVVGAVEDGDEIDGRNIVDIYIVNYCRDMPYRGATSHRAVIKTNK
jgi:hypothetical protein